MWTGHRQGSLSGRYALNRRHGWAGAHTQRRLERAGARVQRRLERFGSRAQRWLGRYARLALELVWPTRCAGCERLGKLLCDDCAAGLPRIEQDSACPRCGAPAGRLVCTECTPVYERTCFSFSQARCALEFSELTRRVVLAYKDGGDRLLAPVLARLMAEVIPFEWRRWADVLTWVPADAQALRRRGFDHMETLARALASQTGMRAQPTLIKQARADQRHLGRAQRRENASALFIVNRPALINPHHPAGHPHHPHHPRKLILIDDVFTTGATLEAASKALISAGARDIRVVTIARVW